MERKTKPKRTIKGRVTFKSSTRHTKNKIPYFYMYLANGNKEWRALASGGAYRRYYNQIQNGGSYSVTCDAKLDGHDLKLNEEDKIEECVEVPLATIDYVLVPLNEIDCKPVESLVTVIGVCQAIATEGSAEEQRTKVMLVDESCHKGVILTMDGGITIEAGSHPVIFVRDARVVEVGGRKELINDGYIQLNPDVPRARELEKWCRQM